MFFKLKKFIFLFLICVSSILSANDVEKKNILLLHSYHSGMTWVENINKAVNDVFTTSKLENYIIYTEYMDTKRHSSKEYLDSFKEIYKKKYMDTKFDIILTSDNNAFNFLIKNRDDIFGEVPVSFCGVNGFDKVILKNVSKFTGVAEQFSDKDTIDTILKLHPNTKNIYIINDYLATGKEWTKDMKKSLQGYKDKVNIIFSENLTLRGLKRKIHTFNKDTVILLGVYFADKNKNYITYEKVGSYLLEDSQAPVYCLLNFNISNNIIGGKVIGGYSQGEAMSKIALRILKGEEASNIPITNTEANEYIFNYNGIKKYDINQDLLPKNCKVLNKPFSLYEEYKVILFTLIIIFASILILFFVVLFYFRYKNKTKSIVRDNLIISIVRFTPIIIIPIVTAFIVWLFIYSTNKNQEEIKNIEKVTYIDNMKQHSKREVDRYIQFVKAQVQSLNKKDIKKLEKTFIKIAQQFQYGKSGYIILGSMEGYMVSHPNPKLIGVDFFDGKHDKAKEVFIKFKDKLEKENGGFVEYTWVNPDSKIEENKITYVSLLPEFNWYVASGVYLDEVDRFIEEKLKSNAVFDEKNINIIILASFVLLVFSFIISVVLSLIIKKVFTSYRKSILNEVQKSKVIEKAKKEFETIFKYAQDGIAITDFEGNFIKFNDAFKELTGFNKSELESKNCIELSVPEDREKNRSAIEHAIKSGHVDNFEKNCIVKDNKVITVHISISLLPNKHSLLLIVKDASSIKLLEEQSKNAAMGEMIGNIAHQWRQPLSVISTGATGLKLSKTYNTLTDKQFFKMCEAINDNAQYLSKTIDDFSDFIKGDRQKVNFSLVKDINSFINLVEGSIKSNNINLIKEIDETINIFGYPNELIQCFINIFNNAKDALKDKIDEKYIFIFTYVKKDKVIIIFKDNAGGIPEEVLPHIFEPYFTTKHKSQGTGLGLSMTYNLIVEGMGGIIEVNNVTYQYNNKQYKGAEFILQLSLQ